MKHAAHGYWLEEAGEPEPLPVLVGELSCDVLVVGGGYTGLWAAWHLSELEPEARVVLLEAEVCGRGPSGRNGGFANSMWFSVPRMRERFGGEAAIAIARAAQRSVEEIGRFCREQEIDAWYRQDGYLQVSGAEPQDGAWAETIAACRELGEPDAVRELDAAEVAGRCRSPRFRAGALYPGSATVQPARLALGLRERLMARERVQIRERSPVRRMRAGPWGCVAEARGGRVRARSCLLAIGPSTGALGSPLRGRLTVTSSHIALTEPVPDLLEEIGWTGGEGITDSRAMIHYFRTTPDGRIAFGWGGGAVAYGARLHGRAEIDPGGVGRMIADLRSFFPGLAGLRITHAWGGPIDVSPAHLPLVAALGGDRVHAAFGYTGNGVGPAHLVGRVLASLALERRDEYIEMALVERDPARVPSGLAGWLGGNLIRAGLERKERVEDAGRVPDPLSRGLAAVPELIGFHIGR